MVHGICYAQRTVKSNTRSCIRFQARGSEDLSNWNISLLSSHTSHVLVFSWGIWACIKLEDTGRCIFETWQPLCRACDDGAERVYRGCCLTRVSCPNLVIPGALNDCPSFWYQFDFCSKKMSGARSILHSRIRLLVWYVSCTEHLESTRSMRVNFHSTP